MLTGKQSLTGFVFCLKSFLFIVSCLYAYTHAYMPVLIGVHPYVVCSCMGVRVVILHIFGTIKNYSTFWLGIYSTFSEQSKTTPHFG